MRSRRALLLLLLLPLVPLGPASAEDASLEVGFAAVALPADAGIPLGGYGARRGAPAEGVHDPVEARALVFRRGDVGVGLISVDLVGSSAELLETLRARTRDLDLDTLVLAATHTHAGPGGLTPVPLWHSAMGTYDASRTAATLAHIEAALRRAASEMAPATLRATQSADPALAALVRNRAVEGGPVDPTLRVMRVEAPDGSLRAAVVHFAAHPTVLPAAARRISAGWPGRLRTTLSEQLGGVPVVVLQGALGDVAPVPPSGAPGDAYERMAAYGDALSPIAAQALEEARGRPADDRLDALGTTEAKAWSSASALLGRGPSALVPREPLALPVTRVRLGATTLVTAPGEPTVSVGRAMGQAADRWVVACAQDHLGYFVDRDAYRRGGYEAEMSFCGPDAADLLAEAAEGRAHSAPREADAPTERLTGDTPRALGAAHGRAWGASIRDLLGACEGHIQDEVLSHGGGIVLSLATWGSGLPARDLVAPALIRAARTLQPNIPPALLDEMEGLARSAGVPYDAVLVENVFVTLTEQTNPLSLLTLPARCTNLVALGEATSMGQLLHGSTLDWGMEEVLASRTVWMEVVPPSGHPFVSVTWPGMVGTLRAMGAQGIAVTEESCAAPADTRLDGLPIGLLLRDVVQHASDLDEAVARVRRGPGTCGYKVTISDGRRLDARVVEATATRSHVRIPQHGLLFGCDPEAGPDCFLGACDPEIPRNDDSSARRYPAVREHLRPRRQRLRLEDVRACLALEAGGVRNDGTLLACVFEPQTGRAHIALGDDLQRPEGYGWQTLDMPARSPAWAAYVPPWPATAGPSPAVTTTQEGPVPFRVEHIVFASPVRSHLPGNDLVRAELFRPPEPAGVVILLPPWKARDLKGDRFLAMQMAMRGIAALVLPLPYQADRAAPGVRSGAWTLSEDLARSYEALFQGAADAARASLLLESEYGFPPEKQAIGGISLGGHVASVVLGAYPERFQAGVFMLAGAGFERVLAEENGVTDGLRARLLARGVTAEEAQALLGRVDPSRFCRPDLCDRVLLVSGDADPVVPRDSVEALAAAWGDAPILWFDGGHYDLIRHAPAILEGVVAHLKRRFDAR